jgi:membrane fusion protein (multidrug efflux system)
VRVDLPIEDGVIALPQTAVTISLYGAYVYAVEDAPAKAGSTPAAGDAAKPEGGAAEAAKPEAEKPALVARQVFVKTGRRSGDLIEVVEGIDPGMRVVTSGQNKLSNGSSVAIDNSVLPVKGATGNPEASKS